ncbi:type VI secretion system lipoprotein TssJ [Mixta tenebrionis]|uniref:Type VI secretion system lipoprotein TssJ n=2 Tax=Mixta tenebrionis TaxID=2562439 RepID=A0A506VDR0_9GAMM|nr:type VI secretion system lipoprotein TssJ [Mixta tenebrionis]TPW43765.1 type VI secretion system lipoprotein TssJ [Mixta tenebrionis]
MMKTTFFSRLAKPALCFAALTLLAGCSFFFGGDPSRYALFVQALPPVNDSAPLKLRVLVLKSDADFMSADFYSLQNNAAAVLGSNLLNSEQFFLMPGQLKKTLSGQLMPEARYIGVMAEYQALNGKKWRLSLALPSPGDASPVEGWQKKSDTLQARIVADQYGVRVAGKQELLPE